MKVFHPSRITDRNIKIRNNSTYSAQCVQRHCSDAFSVYYQDRQKT